VGDKGRSGKPLNYKDLKIEIQFMWNVKTKMIPVIERGNWNNFKIVNKTSEQHNWKARH
jgi:hypothetical protein